MDLLDLINTTIAVAIQGKLTTNEEYFYRKICRFYSKTFNTPLDQVFNLDPYLVFLAYYEESTDKFDLDTDEDVQNMLDKIYGIEDPNYNKAKEENLEHFIKQIETNNEKKIKKAQKKSEPIDSSEKSLLENEQTVTDNLPRGGLINLSYLEKLDNESGGFKE